MNGFTYTLTLLEPVLANSLGGEPNSANSMFYIPGGLVRGAAISSYSGEKEAGSEEFRRLFLDGRTRFLNAYPVSENGRSLPTPLKYKEPKYFHGSELSSLKDGKIHAIEEVWQINVHTQRDAESGHAKEKAGAVYRYVSLPAGLVLEGAVLADNPDDARKIRSLLKKTKTILLGKARTAGYGTAQVDIKDLTLEEDGELLTPKEGRFLLILCSPAIVRDEYGQSTLDISTALKARLRIETINISRAYQRAEIAGGFNRTWGLPLPQVTAIAAGSVFEIEADVDVRTLNELQVTGIGERRAEGFGRVMVTAFLPEIETDDHWLLVEATKLATARPEARLAKNPTAKLMVTRLARKELDEKVIHTARQMTEEYKGNVPNSQLARWRVKIRTVLDKKNKEGKRDVQPLQTFLEESKGKAGWRKLEKTRIQLNEENHPRLTEWLEEWIEMPEKLQAVLKPQLNQRFSLGENLFILDDELNLEYRLRLLDAVLAVMAKKNGGNND